MRQRGLPTRRLIFGDTSALFCLMDRSSKAHRQVVHSLQNLAKRGCGLITSNFIVAETHALTVVRLGPDQGRLFLQSIFDGGVSVERVAEQDELRARQILMTYTDKGYTYTDATSFALMERLEIETALTLDRHFEQYGFVRLPE